MVSEYCFVFKFVECEQETVVREAVEHYNRYCEFLSHEYVLKDRTCLFVAIFDSIKVLPPSASVVTGPPWFTHLLNLLQEL